MSELFEPKRVIVEKTSAYLFVKKFGTVLTIENGEICSLLTDILDSCDSRFLYDAIQVICEQSLKNGPKNN